MAFPGSKIKHPNKLKKEKFSPLAPGIKNKYQLRKAIQRRTEANIRPKLRAVNEQGTEEGLSHSGRKKDLAGYYDYYGTQVQDAYTKAQEAMNQVLATTAGANTGSQATMLAALESTHAGDLAQANAVGGVLPQGLGDDVAVEAAGAGNASLADLANIQSSNAGLAAGRIATAGLGRVNALSGEDARFTAIQKELRDKRGEIKEETPAAREEARKAILDEELARASEREREKIARGSLKLEGKKTNEEVRSNKANEAISWAAIQAEKEKFKKEVAGAGGEAEKEQAEARAEQYNRGVEIFQGYFDNTKPKSYDPKTLYRNLTLTVSPEVALKIMSHGPPRFQEFVANRSGSKKQPSLRRKRREHEGRVPQPGVPAGPRNSG